MRTGQNVLILQEKCIDLSLSISLYFNTTMYPLAANANWLNVHQDRYHIFCTIRHTQNPYIFSKIIHVICNLVHLMNSCCGYSPRTNLLSYTALKNLSKCLSATLVTDKAALLDWLSERSHLTQGCYIKVPWLNMVCNQVATSDQRVHQEVWKDAFPRVSTWMHLNTLWLQC